MSKNQPVLERFFDKVVINEETGCWEFTSSISNSNCGRFTYKYKSRDAYKIGYILMGGEIPEGHDLHHVCENRLCVNPEHLIPVTRAVHIGDLTPHHITYKNKRKTTCPKGHPLSGDNLKKTDKGVRICLACARRRSRECTMKKRIKNRALGLTKDSRLKWSSEEILEMQTSSLPRKELMKKFNISASRLSTIIIAPEKARSKSTIISKLNTDNPYRVKDVYYKEDLLSKLDRSNASKPEQDGDQVNHSDQG